MAPNTIDFDEHHDMKGKQINALNSYPRPVLHFQTAVYRLLTSDRASPAKGGCRCVHALNCVMSILHILVDA